MKRRLQFFLLIVGCCLIQSISFSQDDINKEYAVKFAGNKTKLSKQANVTLDSIASAMKSHPAWNYAISCYTVCNSRKSAAIWDRVNTIVITLVEKYGIKAERFIFRYDENSENIDEVRLRYTAEEGSTYVAPPYRNLRKKVNKDACPPVSPSSI